ncbi:MAG TPA: twin-arginine translocase subunit TatC, partial [Tepidisphaeraceae bacterium]
MPDPTEPHAYDPDSYRMSIGDHLDELRRRLILALVGLAAALAGCLFFGTNVMTFVCRPLIDVLRRYDLNPQMYFSNVGDMFGVYLKCSIICAGVLASPWILWQIWQFVAAGLYANERKTVTRYIPLSIGLMLVGVLFVYYLVLPWTLQFLVSFSINIPLPEELSTPVTTGPTTAPVSVARFVETLPGDPAKPQAYQLWFDTQQQRLKLFVDGKIRVIQFGAENLASPMILLPDYVDLVLGMVVIFGISFQMPLAVLALATLGIVEIEQLRGARKIVYFVLAIIAAVIT